jgi:uncharacterized protein YegJ (DUF2314 family)
MKLLQAILILSILVSCNNDKGYSKEENGGDEVYGVDHDDKTMNNAIAKAVASYDEFLKVLVKPDSNTTEFTVKMKFAYGNEGDAEHMWFNDLHFKQDKLFGVLDNDPLHVTTVKAGDTLEIKKEIVSDWMYVKDFKMVGGYTIKVLFDNMSKAEQKEFKDQIGFDIE